MLGALKYPIILAEMGTYQRDVDEWFSVDEHEQIKTFLALHPESGEIIPDTGGIRKLRWPIKNRGNNRAVRIVYYFRDLNMPLYLLALYRKGERIDLREKCKREMRKLVNELVVQHSVRWNRLAIVSPERGA
jgi:hypothetical protein